MKRPGTDASTLEWARYYLRHGWKPVPVPKRQKHPHLKNWPKLRLKDNDLPKNFRNGSNIGLLLGAPSRGLGDVDLDSPEAVALAPTFLPNTDMIHGRIGKRESHWWYKGSSDLRYEKFSDVDGKTLLELRSRTGYQTLVPPSVHPSGEKLVWSRKGKPARVDGERLRGAVTKLASCALVARHWPEIGTRNETALALAGFLLKRGISENHAKVFIVNAATTAKDEELQKREQSVRDTAEKSQLGKRLPRGQHSQTCFAGMAKRLLTNYGSGSG